MEAKERQQLFLRRHNKIVFHTGFCRHENQEEQEQPRTTDKAAALLSTKGKMKTKPVELCNYFLCFELPTFNPSITEATDFL